jgi:hypothetical protein
MRYLAVLAMLLAAPAAADEHGMPMANPNYTPHPPKEGYSYPDCYCTDSQGKRVELGQVACLRIGSKEVLARCDTSVNLTTWRRIQDGCPGV